MKVFTVQQELKAAGPQTENSPPAASEASLAFIYLRIKWRSHDLRDFLFFQDLSA